MYFDLICYSIIVGCVELIIITLFLLLFINHVCGGENVMCWKEGDYNMIVCGHRMDVDSRNMSWCHVRFIVCLCVCVSACMLLGATLCPISICPRSTRDKKKAIENAPSCRRSHKTHKSIRLCRLELGPMSDARMFHHVRSPTRILIFFYDRVVDAVDAVTKRDETDRDRGETRREMWAHVFLCVEFAARIYLNFALVMCYDSSIFTRLVASKETKWVSGGRRGRVYQPSVSIWAVCRCHNKLSHDFWLN